MKIVFLGYAVSEQEAEVLSGSSIAGNNMQVNVLKGFRAHDDIDLTVVSIPPVAAFPKDKTLFYKKGDAAITPDIVSKRVGFINLPLVKQFFQARNTYRIAKRFVDQDTIVFAFNQYPQVGNPCMKLKKKTGCKVVSLVADPPLDDNGGKKSGMMRDRYFALTRKALASCDALIVLNKQVVDTYAPGTPFTVVEGGAPIAADATYEAVAKTDKTIVYSGALTNYSGVMNAIEAMRAVKDPQVCLEIYGGGPLEAAVAQAAATTANVRFCGKVAHEEMKRRQREAFLLINPRVVDDEIARHTFPSKMFEYMTSGTPVLATPLNGFSEEFLEHIFVIHEDPSTMAQEIDRIAAMSDAALADKARAAFEFIKTKKSWDAQNQVIYKFLSDGACV